MVESKMISTDDQQEYQLDAGMLLYLVKHLQSDIANMTWEQSKANNSAYPAAFKELLHVI